MFTAFLKRTEACVETEAVIRIPSILLGCMETHKNKHTDLWFQLPPAFVYCLFSSQPINNFSIIQFPCSLVFQPLSFLPLSLKTHMCMLKTEDTRFRVYLGRTVWQRWRFQMQRFVI